LPLGAGVIIAELMAEPVVVDVDDSDEPDVPDGRLAPIDTDVLLLLDVPIFGSETDS
jgi:hypothetical protein